ncbi:MAG TPA: N-acetyl-alpha-D-glucosaminyl L-malate synthase BshA, partial [Cryomorphaceae bacterium]|nr:N-acetyl-alpha-D-glucosaminyl L-malate synthase BshA [Cryomorphaceae bacterium]
MLGEGPEKERARQQAQELGIGDKVKFLGKTSEVVRVLCISDLFLLPSEAESFGLAALEAMAAGVPVISSNTGGIPEVNINGVTGFTADVGDVDRMAEKALYILQGDARLYQFGRQARQQAEKFSLEQIGPKYFELYQEALGLVGSH